MSEDLYREIILDRFRDPQFRGEMAESDVDASESNPLCGDELRIQLKFDEAGKVSAVGWTGQGCAISLSSADMLAERMIGLSVEEIRALTKDDVLSMMGIDPGPTRVKCALLSLSTIKKGLLSR